MQSIQILDTSLRDGGFRTDFHFTDDDLCEILISLDSSGIEYIEIGYRKGALNNPKNMGRAGHCDRDYLQLCNSFITNAISTVMIYPNNVNERDLFELKKYGVGMVRLCITKHSLTKALEWVRVIKELGMQVAVNLVLMTHYSDDELDAIMAQINKQPPDVIYLADSNGSILPERIQAIYGRFTSQYSVPFGFHAHDNIGMAQANALAALDSGATFIDTSLAGMGKGIGNLKTEFFIAYLHAIHIRKYNLNAALTAANYVRDVLHIGHEIIDMDEFLRGIFDSKV